MSRLVYERRFDWDEARRLRGEGMAFTQIAERMGVSPAAIYRVVVPGARERINASAASWVMGGICSACGKTGVSRTARDKSRRCVECARKKQATSVREGELLCFGCREWKPDGEFPANRQARARRSRHGFCRGCQAWMRQRSRERRKVPCAECGRLRGHPSDNGAGVGRDTGLCRDCYHAQRRRVA